MPMSQVDPDFGRYLASVAERDVDLLLMEEFHVSDEFVTWFCDQIGLPGITPDGAWHSVSDTDGESDLLLRVIKSGSRIGVLIENKVAAPEQDDQDRRYHLRGIKSREQGKLDEYVTVICAPNRYLASLSAVTAYQHQISYEKIVGWFAAQDSRRAQWRRHVIGEAIEQSRRGYTMAVNEVITAFHLAYWQYLQKHHPRIRMVRPKNRGSKSNWIIFTGWDFPKGVRIHHKFDAQVMELGFDGHTVEEILAAKPDWPEDIVPVQKGKTASLSIRVPAIDMKVDLAQQTAEVEQAISAAYRLMPFASLLKNFE
jgi:hypothetical protein